MKRPSYSSIISDVDRARVDAHRRVDFHVGKEAELEDDLNETLKKAMSLLAQLKDLERRRTDKFRPGMRVRFKGLGSVRPREGTPNDHMELCEEGYSRALLVFDGKGRAVGYEREGTVLKEKK